MRKQDLDKWMGADEEALMAGEPQSSGVTDLDVPPARRPAAPAPSTGSAPATDEGGLSDLWSPESPAAVAESLAQMLERQGVITAAQMTQAVNLQKQTPGKSQADILIEMGVDEAAVQEAVDERFYHRLGPEYCKANGVLPLRESGSRIVVGVTDPRRLFTLDDVRRKLNNRPLKVVLVTTGDIKAVIESRTEDRSADNNVGIDEIIKDIQEDDVEVVAAEEENVDLEKQAGESPVIRFVNYLIYDAVKNGASDIHVEPQEKKLRVRYRIDGILYEMMSPPHSMHAAIVSRLKIMANLDISERRLPQDGRIRAMVHGRKLDLRLSTLPTGQGEKAVMRILDSRSVQITLEQLGMPGHALQHWRQQIDEPHGIILVTGPTGSGKTTTLYSSLNQMDRRTLNISTVEDPIEYHLNGINQVQTHEKIGMTFAAALRSLLRQDPDVVMVGEIRDDETARIAVQAALTGHLVLSTLHTNDAPSAITRLINIGVEPFLIAAAVNAVLAQRLVRRVCEKCKKPVAIDAVAAQHLSSHGIRADQLYKGAGCERCHNSGYSGRVGLYELLVLDDVTRDAVVSRPSVTEFRRMCIERGMQTLRLAGFHKMVEGVTTLEEVLRVTQSEGAAQRETE
jgi:type IV pilus assembly protein PilB